MHEKECCMFAYFFSFLNKFIYLIINKNTILNMGGKTDIMFGHYLTYWTEQW